MVTGESGTGKELVAQAIHDLSPRAHHPFIAINCAAIPRDLLESQIFGHEKGSFTGAIEQHRGCFERADKGTLFLDEIAEMDIGLQAKLLRLIQDQSFYRIGGTQLINVNVRIIAATNRDPLKMVEIGKFREDLFYRLNVLPIHLPPLRERRQDIALIATNYLHKVAEQNRRRFHGFDLDALTALENHPWSGNIRELQNVIEQTVVLHEGEKLTLEMLPEAVRSRSGMRPAVSAGDNSSAGYSNPGAARLDGGSPESLRPFWQVERDEIQRALNYCKGNVQEVARRLEISAATLYRKIEKYGLVK
jgi:transcriptional regulator with PAS, ATPase and Fis domain